MSGYQDDIVVLRNGGRTASRNVWLRLTVDERSEPEVRSQGLSYALTEADEFHVEQVLFGTKTLDVRLPIIPSGAEVLIWAPASFQRVDFRNRPVAAQVVLASDDAGTYAALPDEAACEFAPRLRI